MKITKITTGVLNELKNFYGNIEIDENKSGEAYNLLQDEVSEDMKRSSEFWTGEFEHDGKRYAIAGDGALTSSGDYVLGKIEKTYDVVFSDDTSDDNKGFEEPLEYCKDYIRSNNGTNNSYFEDYKGGTVWIKDNQTEEMVYSEKVR
ncbi:MAG: hypothetical protein LKE54_07315 [Prevotella sp.]|jgi:hypothetical protein|nr:hypothetical protein [Prevotella sp.]MCH3994842.1 hypothetical protein [Prevotella sp.]